jgi:predicted AlkP superfamily pyrophosphatase or phosphodiesterase
MAATSQDRIVPLAGLVDPADVDLVADGTFATLNPKPGHEAAAAAALLRPHDHVTCWRHGELPARFHYGNNPRVPAFFCLAEVGWLIQRPGGHTTDVGNHGYDNDAPEMRAIFLAAGPAFRPGVRLPEFDNVDVYPLVARLIHVAPRPNDGTLDVFRAALR